MTDLMRDPFELRQVQCLDGLYVHAGDVVASLRARAAQFAELANETGDDAYRAVSEAFALHADQIDVAAIGCVTENPSPWAAGRTATKEH